MRQRQQSQRAATRNYLLQIPGSYYSQNIAQWRKALEYMRHTGDKEGEQLIYLKWHHYQSKQWAKGVFSLMGACLAPLAVAEAIPVAASTYNSLSALSSQAQWAAYRMAAPRLVQAGEWMRDFAAVASPYIMPTTLPTIRKALMVGGFNFVSQAVINRTTSQLDSETFWGKNLEALMKVNLLSTATAWAPAFSSSVVSSGAELPLNIKKSRLLFRDINADAFLLNTTIGTVANKCFDSSLGCRLTQNDQSTVLITSGIYSGINAPWIQQPLLKSIYNGLKASEKIVPIIVPLSVELSTRYSQSEISNSLIQSNNK